MQRHNCNAKRNTRDPNNPNVWDLVSKISRALTIAHEQLVGIASNTLLDQTCMNLPSNVQSKVSNNNYSTRGTGSQTPCLHQAHAHHGRIQLASGNVNVNAGRPPSCKKSSISHSTRQHGIQNISSTFEPYTHLINGRKKNCVPKNHGHCRHGMSSNQYATKASNNNNPTYCEQHNHQNVHFVKEKQSFGCSRYEPTYTQQASAKSKAIGHCCQNKALCAHPLHSRQPMHQSNCPMPKDPATYSHSLHNKCKWREWSNKQQPPT